MKRPDLAARNRGDGGLYEDREWFRRRYEDDDRSFREMADEAGCSLRTIARWVRIHEIPVVDPLEKRQRRNPIQPLPGGRKPSYCACGSQKTKASATCMGCRDFTGEKNPKWRGEAIENPQAHGRVKKLRGSARDYPCQHCQGPAAHWAYDHADPNEKSHDEGPYSVDPEHYMPLCVSCHKRFDLAYLRQIRGAA